MENFIRYSIFVHVLAGCIALITGLVSILLRNNVKRHKKAGIIYFYAMTVVFVTAAYVSVYKQNIFLLCVAFFTYYACLTAYRALKLKRLHLDQKPGIIDWSIEVFFGLMHVSFLAFALLLLKKGHTEVGIVSLVFGVFGLRGNYITIHRLCGKSKHKNYWLLAHIGGMLGSYIGAITAFFVNNNARWIHLPEIVAWLGPTALITPLIIFELRKYKSKGT